MLFRNLAAHSQQGLRHRRTRPRQLTMQVRCCMISAQSAQCKDNLRSLNRFRVHSGEPPSPGFPSSESQ